MEGFYLGYIYLLYLLSVAFCLLKLMKHDLWLTVNVKVAQQNMIMKVITTDETQLMCLKKQLRKILFTFFRLYSKIYLTLYFVLFRL